MSDTKVEFSGIATIDGQEYVYEISEGATGPGIRRINLVDRDGYGPAIIGEKQWNLMTIKLGREEAIEHFVKEILEGADGPKEHTT